MGPGLLCTALAIMKFLILFCTRSCKWSSPSCPLAPIPSAFVPHGCSPLLKPTPMSRSLLGGGFHRCGWNHLVTPRCACRIFFLPHSHWSLWPGCVAAHRELQAGGHVLWIPQRAEAMLHVPIEVFFALFGGTFYLLPQSPSACAPNALHSLKRKLLLKCLLVIPPLLSDPSQWPATSPPLPFPQILPSPPPATFLPAAASSMALWHRLLFSCEVLTKQACTLFKEQPHLQLSLGWSEYHVWSILISATKSWGWLGKWIWETLHIRCSSWRFN